MVSRLSLKILFWRKEQDFFMAQILLHLLHTRQLIELHWAYTTHCLQPYQVAYAGSW